MCGLVGMVMIDGEYYESLNTRLRAAIKTLHHRGPDGQGLLLRTPIGFGHTRLSIIDLNDTSSQPMLTRDNRYAIVFNGEIYNFRILYERFLSSRSDVNKNSDTSVLLHLFAEFGRKCLDMLEGMYAFAIFDFLEGKLFAARDRFGEKPFYWMHCDGGIAFASEIRALRSLVPDSQWRIDLTSLCLYEVTGSVPAPRTIYCGVTALEAGCWVEVSNNGKIEHGRYWNLADVADELSGDMRSYGQIVDETQSLLLKATQSCLVSDVPVGLFLSGGYDSSALLGLCEQLGANNRQALCIDFDEKGYSEFAFALAAAKHYRGNLHRLVISESDFESGIADFFHAMDQPTVDGYNTFFVCRAARELGIKVWLSGVGGDELFGGYPSFRRMATWTRASRYGQRVVPNVTQRSSVKFLRNSLRLARAIALLESGDPRLRAYQACRNTIPWRYTATLGSAQAVHGILFPGCLDRHYPAIPNSFDNFQVVSLFESSTYMRNQLLRDMDNFSMASSLELRAPYLNHRLFGIVLALKQKYKVLDNRTKPLLADALPNPLPEVVLNRSKQGFAFPMEKWAYNGMRNAFCELVFDRIHEEYWDRSTLEALWKGFERGRLHWSVLWQFYTFARWRASH